jgi:hypothetical protein
VGWAACGRGLVWAVRSMGQLVSSDGLYQLVLYQLVLYQLVLYQLVLYQLVLYQLVLSHGQYGASVNQLTDLRETPLHIAATGI